VIIRGVSVLVAPALVVSPATAGAAKGYRVTYSEVPGGRHAPEYWRASTAGGHRDDHGGVAADPVSGVWTPTARGVIFAAFCTSLP
jgi:hypothetical protein